MCEVICVGVGGCFVTDESVKAIHLLFAWQILELGPWPLIFLWCRYYFIKKQLYKLTNVWCCMLYTG